MDEMWSFVHDKAQQYWLWWAVDHCTGVPLAYCFGTREHKHLDELRALLVPFHIDKIYSDDNYAYKKHITESTVVTGKRNTQRIERNHPSHRTWCSRLVRKGIRFSKLHLMHRIVIGLKLTVALGAGRCRFICFRTYSLVSSGINPFMTSPADAGRKEIEFPLDKYRKRFTIRLTYVLTLYEIKKESVYHEKPDNISKAQGYRHIWQALWD